MIPEKVKKKLREKCDGDQAIYEVLLNLLEYEESGRGKQQVHCGEVVAKYAKGEAIDED